jgi:hypothetical protein
MSRDRSLTVAALLLVWAASAHRVDEYLEATTISLGTDRIEGQIRLTPGVAVAAFVMTGIDTDGDGRVSDGEQRAYAERVLRDVSLSVDGDRLRVRLVSTTFPEAEAMKEGLGAIQVDFGADVRREGGARTLVFENRHQKGIAAYLVNCLEPRDPEIRVTAQRRNYEQSHYEIDYTLPGSRRQSVWWWGLLLALPAGRLALLLWRRQRRSEAPGVGRREP